MSEIRTVTLKDLCPDRCNFKDKAFESWVSEFMERNMPGFPLGLLQVDGVSAYERWQVQPEKRYHVETLNLVVFTCHGCGEEYPFSDDGPEHVEEPKEVCCPLEAIGEQEDEEPELYEREDRAWVVIADHHYAQVTYVDTAGDHEIEVPDIGPSTTPRPTPSTVWGWYPDDVKEAEGKAREMDYESMSENQHGFPWANNWCFMPDDFITDEELSEAGFVVAQYCGGSGDWSNDSEYRLCGIDGGGYGFKGQHFAPLAAAVAARCNWTVPTDEGTAHIKAEE